MTDELIRKFLYYD